MIETIRRLASERRHTFEQVVIEELEASFQPLRKEALGNLRYHNFRWSVDKIKIEGRTKSGRATIIALKLNQENLVRLRIIWLAIGSTPPDWQTPLIKGLKTTF